MGHHKTSSLKSGVENSIASNKPVTSPKNTISIVKTVAINPKNTTLNKKRASATSAKKTHQ